MTKFDLQLFAAETGLITSADIEPAISIDCMSRINQNIDELKKVLGIPEMTALSAGNTIKIYKWEEGEDPAQVGEGEDIALTKYSRKIDRTIDLELNKYRKATTAEDIQKVGRQMAINESDAKLVARIQKKIKKQFFSTLEAGTGSVSGAALQPVLAKAWGAITKYHEDEDATPIFLVSSDDVAEYLGAAQITMQQAFGFTYIENFLGLGTAIVSPALTKGKVVATAKENLHGAYIPAGSGDVAQTFGLTADQTGYVGMTHQVVGKNATVETLIMSGVVFYPEYIDGVFVGTITGA